MGDEITLGAFEARALQHALREPKTLAWFVQELAFARGINDDRTTRALDLVSVGLDYLLGNDANEEKIARMHAVYRGTRHGDQEAAEADALRGVAERVESAAADPRTLRSTNEVDALRSEALIAWMLGDDLASAKKVDRAWFARRLEKLRARKLSAARVVAEMTWRAGSHGADGYRRVGEGDEPSAKWIDRVRKAIARGR